MEKMQGHQRKKVLFLMAAVILVSLSVALIVVVAAPGVSIAYGTPPEANHEGYEATQKAYIAEVQADMVVYRHVTTDTEVLTLIPTDTSQDSVFGISFRTIPSSDNGVAHILEHSVLDGSEKYPTKDPFNDMMRGSLQTYLNAFTYDDRTVYTVASRNAADFSNLVSVYLDAVFRPRCVTEEGSWILRQEGWRIEQDEDGNLELTGVVLSEMKGVYSDPDELMLIYAQQSLFPNTSYRFDSGGLPSKISTLNHSDFVDFYEKFYHPTNAQIFLYGPLEHVEDGLKQAHAYLEQSEVRSDIRQESRVEWQEFLHQAPVQVRKPYQSSDVDYRVMTSWLVNDRALDSITEIAWFVVNELLMGTPTSRLRRELQDSGYGDSVIGEGIEFMLQQWTFHVGLQGIRTEDNIFLASQLIMDTLDEIAITGFGADEVATAMNTVEFSLRELNTGKDPRGLAILLSALKVWNYGRDPRAAITFEDAFQELKETVNKSGSEIFVSLIRERLLLNTHRVVIELYPSPTVEEETMAEENMLLEAMQEQLTAEQFAALLNQSEQLAQIQATDDSPEVLATIPSLSLEDINPVGDEHPIYTYTEASVLVAEHPVKSSFGILYVDFGMDMSVINLEDLSLVPLLAHLMVESGTSKLDDVHLARRIGAKTGGINIETMVEAMLPSKVEDDAFVVPDGNLLETKLFFRAKCTKEQVSELFSLYREILFDGREFSKEKTLTILKEMIDDLQDSIGEDGDLFVARRIAARYTVYGYIKEQLEGITHLQKLKEALETAESDFGVLWAKLNRMKRALIEGHRNGMILNLTGEKQLLVHTQEDAILFVTNGIPLNEDATPFPNFAEEEHPWVAQAKEDMPLLAPLTDEGIIIPTSVSYVGGGGVLYSRGEPIHGSAAVVTMYLERGYLYENLRLARGAYGAYARLRKYSGMLDLLTYRDPNLVETLRIYDGAFAALTEDFASSETLPPEAKGTIIGAIGVLDGSAPQPDQLGWDSLGQHLRRETSKMRQAWRDEILGTTRDDFLNFSNRLSEMTNSSIAVVSSRAAIEDAQTQGVNLELVLV